MPDTNENNEMNNAVYNIENVSNALNQMEINNTGSQVLNLL